MESTKLRRMKMPTDGPETTNAGRRSELVGAIGEAIMDGCEQHPPFPAMPSSVAWEVAREIAKRLESVGVKLA
jgi:hypothetical protein